MHKNMLPSIHKCIMYTWYLVVCIGSSLLLGLLASHDFWVGGDCKVSRDQTYRPLCHHYIMWCADCHSHNVYMAGQLQWAEEPASHGSYHTVGEKHYHIHCFQSLFISPNISFTSCSRYPGLVLVFQGWRLSGKFTGCVEENQLEEDTLLCALRWLSWD